MLNSLIWTGLLMGLAGGPHCVAMCGVACSAIANRDDSSSAAPQKRDMLFQLGRLLGYSVLGAVSALFVSKIAWLAQSAVVLRPVWVMFHVGILLWGITLLIYARQPHWVNAVAYRAWQRIAPLTKRSSHVFLIGAAWALMPCGLLYSALLLAALSGDVLAGATTMGLFAIGSSVSLLIAPWLWRALQEKFNNARLAQNGIRLSGLVLLGLGSWALWMDLSHQTALWCST